MDLISIFKKLYNTYKGNQVHIEPVIPEEPVSSISEPTTNDLPIDTELVLTPIPVKKVVAGKFNPLKPTVSPDGYLAIACKEGISRKPYLCSAGVKTVGLGSTVSDIPDLPKWSWDKEISIEEAVRIFKKGMEKYSSAVVKALKVPVTQQQFDALVSITYNIGVGGMAKSTFVKLVNAKASPSEIGKAIMMWKKPVEIIGRRQKEVDLFIKGSYNITKVSLIDVNPVTHKPRYNSSLDLKGYF